MKRPLVTSHLLAASPGAIEQAAALVGQGELVVFPTDTVYGLGAAAFDSAAIAALYRVKERPVRKAIPILLAERAALASVAGSIPELAERLMAHFWPGPLTIVLPGHPDLPPQISPDGSVAVRVLDHGVGGAFIAAAGGAVAASSANISGQPAALSGAAALAALGGRVAAVLDDGRSPRAQASTVVDCRGASVIVLRPGPVTVAQLAQTGIRLA